LRSERSREAIATALYELVGDGNLTPTAQQVSERAGVGIRSVFRHFADMEALYATLDARLSEEVFPILREARPQAGLHERVAALVKRRAALFERIAPYKRASNLHRRRSPFLRSRHGELVRELRSDLLRWLPELAQAQRAIVEALDQATSFEAWDRLRDEQRLGRARATAAMELAALSLIRNLGDRDAGSE
jgi:AcrR family transcriptional regulator